MHLNPLLHMPSCSQEAQTSHARQASQAPPQQSTHQRLVMALQTSSPTQGTRNHPLAHCGSIKPTQSSQTFSHHLCVLQTASAFEHQLRSHSESTVLSRQSATSQPAFCCDQVSPWYTGPPSVISLTVQSAWRQAFTLTRSVPHNRPICLSAGRSPLTRGSKSHLHPTCTQHAPCADAQDTIP